MKKTIALITTSFLIILFSFKNSHASNVEKLIHRKLIVVSENPLNPNYNIYGITNFDSCFKYIFSKVWIHHASIIYVSRDSLRSIIRSSNPEQYAVIQLSLLLDKHAGDMEWKNYFILGLYAGEELTKDPNVVNNKKPELAYIFPTDFFKWKKPAFDELILAVKFINEKIKCELEKTNCNLEDEINANKSSLKEKTLVIFEESLYEDTKKEIAKTIFPCKLIIVKAADYWKLIGEKKEQYAFLSMAAFKLGTLSTSYYIVDMTTLKILNRYVPGGSDRISSWRFIEPKHLKKIIAMFSDEK